MTATPDPRIDGSRKYPQLGLLSSPFPSTVPWPTMPKSLLRARMISIDAVASEIAKWSAKPNKPERNA